MGWDQPRQDFALTVNLSAGQRFDTRWTKPNRQELVLSSLKSKISTTFPP